MTITITINGESREVETTISLLELIEQLGFYPKSVAALVNDEIIDRDKFEEKTLAADDVVELVRFVPGG